MTTPTAIVERTSISIGGVLVESCAPRTAAYKSGIRAGDHVLSIDGAQTADCLDVIFHSASESFAITLRRKDSVFETIIERDYGEAHGMILEDPPIRECTNFCPFCFVDQAPKHRHFRKGLEIKDDDYRYSFLYGHYVTLTNLSRADFTRIESMRLSPLYISIHATDPLVRAKLLGRPKVDPMPVLKKLMAASIEMHTQIVMIRGLNDGDVMKRTISDLFELHSDHARQRGEGGVQSVAIVPVGLTSYHEQGVTRWQQQEANSALEEILRVGAEYPQGFVQAADEWFSILEQEPPSEEYYGGMAVEENGVGMVRRMLDDWKILKLPKRVSARSCLVVTGKSPEIFIRRIVNEMAAIPGADIEIGSAINTTYGATTTVTGLLGWRDIAPVIAESEKPVVYIPEVMLNGDSRFLDDITLDEARAESRRDIRVAATSAAGLYSILQ